MYEGGTGVVQQREILLELGSTYKRKKKKENQKCNQGRVNQTRAKDACVGCL